MKKQYANNDNVVIADINKELSSFIKHIGAIEGYPTMKYIGNKGRKVETYEESKIPVKDRSTDSFIKWIETKIDRVVANTHTRNQRHRRGGNIILGGNRGGNIILGGHTSNNRKRNNRKRTRKY